MSGKIKLLLAFLALGAFISASYLISAFRTQGTGAVLAGAASRNFNVPGSCQRDTDSDGLSDCEERFWNTGPEMPDTDGDGFVDGEEVLSGHNPNVKGPNDFLDKNKNITERTAALAAGGIFAGALNPNSPAYDADVQKLTNQILREYEANAAITLDDLRLVGDSAKEKMDYAAAMAFAIKGVIVPALDDASAFLTTVQDLTIDDPAPLTGDALRLTRFVLDTQRLAASSAARAQKIAAIAVPRSFSIQHKNAVRLMRTLQRQYELAGAIKRDPILGMVALNAIVGLHAESMPRFLADLTQAFHDNLAP